MGTFDAAIEVLREDYGNHRLPYGDFGSNPMLDGPSHTAIADSIEAAIRVLEAAGHAMPGDRDRMIDFIDGKNTLFAGEFQRFRALLSALPDGEEQA